MAVEIPYGYWGDAAEHGRPYFSRGVVAVSCRQGEEAGKDGVEAGDGGAGVIGHLVGLCA